MKALTEFQSMAVSAALDKLLNGSYFDVTALRKIADLLDIQLGGTDYEALEALHCVHYSKMDPSLCRQVREKVLEMLSLPPDYVVRPINPVTAGLIVDVSELEFVTVGGDRQKLSGGVMMITNMHWTCSHTSPKIHTTANN